MLKIIQHSAWSASRVQLIAAKATPTLITTFEPSIIRTCRERDIAAYLVSRLALPHALGESLLESKLSRLETIPVHDQQPVALFQLEMKHHGTVSSSHPPHATSQPVRALVHRLKPESLFLSIRL